MGSPGFVARLQIRRRWRSLVVLALFVAIVGGIAAALIAGARRSSSVVHRYFDATIPYNLLVGAQSLPRSRLLAIPGVERVDRDTYFASTYVGPDGKLGDGINSVIYDRSSIDRTIRVVSGRLPSASDASAVLVNEAFVRQFGLHTGDSITVKTFAPRDLNDVQANNYDAPHGPDYRFQVAAVIRTPLDIAIDVPRTIDRDSSYGSSSAMYVPNAFYDANHTHFLGFGEAFDVQLRPSTSIREFESADAARPRQLRLLRAAALRGAARVARHAGRPRDRGPAGARDRHRGRRRDRGRTAARRGGARPRERRRPAPRPGRHPTPARHRRVAAHRPVRRAAVHCSRSRWRSRCRRGFRSASATSWSSIEASP